MNAIRRWTGRIAVAWLLCHGATLAAAPSILLSGVLEPQVECTCDHGDHAYCPMHHKPDPDHKQCSMGSGMTGNLAVLTSMFGGLGLMPSAATDIAAPPVSALVVIEPVTITLRPPPPDPLPPRV